MDGIKEGIFLTIRIDNKILAKSILEQNDVSLDFINNKNSLRTLLLVLAGDSRVIDQMSLRDMSDLFNDAIELLTEYNNASKTCLNISMLENYQVAHRRAL